MCSTLYYNWQQSTKSKLIKHTADKLSMLGHSIQNLQIWIWLIFRLFRAEVCDCGILQNYIYELSTVKNSTLVPDDNLQIKHLK